MGEIALKLGTVANFSTGSFGPDSIMITCMVTLICKSGRSVTHLATTDFGGGFSEMPGIGYLEKRGEIPFGFVGSCVCLFAKHVLNICGKVVIPQVGLAQP